MRFYASRIKCFRPSPTRWRVHASLRHSSSTAAAIKDDGRRTLSRASTIISNDSTDAAVESEDADDSSLIRIVAPSRPTRRRKRSTKPAKSQQSGAQRSNVSPAGDLKLIRYLDPELSKAERSREGLLRLLHSSRRRYGASLVELERLNALKPENTERDECLRALESQNLGAAWDVIKAAAAKPQEPGAKKIALTSQHAIRLLLTSISQWLEQGSSDLPAPSEAAQLLDQVASIEGAIYQDALWALFTKLLYYPLPAVQSLRTKTIESEMVKLWHYTVHRSSEAPHTPSIENLEYLAWPKVAAGTFGGAGRAARNVRIGPARIEKLWPRLPESDRDELFTLAVAIFYYLSITGSWRSNTGIRSSIPFLAALVYKSDTSRAQKVIMARKPATKHSSELVEDFEAALQDVSSHPIMVFLSTTALRSVFNQPRSASVSSVMAERLVVYFINILGRMYERGIFSYFRHTWDIAHRAFTLAARQNATTSQTCASKQQDATPLPNDLYRMFLLTAFRMKSMTTAWSVWKHMKSVTVPQLADWTAMISGMGTSGNLASVERLWLEMLEAGIQPDAAAWNARVQGLFINGRAEEGMHALNLWCNTWKNGSTSQKVEMKNPWEVQDSNSCQEMKSLVITKPNARTLNTVLQSIRMTRPELVPEILNWAKSMEIEWNAYTFNIMLSFYKADNRSSRFVNTFNRMLDENVVPDMVTYDMLNRYICGMYEKTVSERILCFLQIVDKALEHGLTPTSQTYAPVLEMLLSHRNSSQEQLDAAKELLLHSKQFGRSVYAALITIATKRLLSHEPPNVDLVNQMRQDMLANDSASTADFYNECLLGYAKLHKLGAMKASVETARSLGMTPTWEALLACMQACFETSNQAVAQELLLYASQAVANGVMETEGVSKQSLVEEQRQRFWRLVARMKVHLVEPDAVFITKIKCRAVSLPIRRTSPRLEADSSVVSVPIRRIKTSAEVDQI